MFLKSNLALPVRALSLKSRAYFLLILVGLMVPLFFSLRSLWVGYDMVGKTFSGFGIEFSFITFPVDSQDWTGSKADLQYYEQIQQVDGKVFQNSTALNRYIQSLPPDKPVTYSVIRNQKSVKLVVPTMTFGLADYFKIFVINTVLAFFYAGLAVFILLRRHRIEQSQILLLLTFSFTAIYALRSSYDYLHACLPLALIAYCAFPLSLLLLGLHLVRSKKANRWLNGLEKFNVILTVGVALALAGLSVYLAPAPYQHQQAFTAFIALYQFLVAYSMLGVLGFMGLVLWRSLRKNEDELRNWQARIILIGSLFSFLPYVMMMGAIWVFRMPWNLPTELIATNTYLFVLFVAYAILHDEGVALEVLFKKAVFFYIMLSLFGIAYMVMYRVVEICMEVSFLPAAKQQVPFLAGFVAFILISLVNNRLQHLVMAIFYRQRKHLKSLLEAFVEDSTNTLEPQKIVSQGLRFLQQAYAPQTLALFLLPHAQADGSSSYFRYFDEKATYPEQLQLTTPLATASQLRQFKLETGLEKEVVLPLHKNDVLLGVILLGKKGSGLGYFAEDLELLKQFAFYFVTGFYIARQSQKSLVAQEKTDAAQRMEVLGTLAGGVAHDFNNLLSTIVMSVGLMKYLSEDPEIIERLRVIQLSAEKGAEITKALADYASTLPPDQAVPIGTILDDFQSQLQDTLPAGIELCLNADEQVTRAEPFILADQEQLQRVLLELARNAVLAMSGQGTLTITCQQTWMPSPSEPFAADKQAFLCLRISDTGCGIPESIRQRIFEPFFSAWPEGKGIGLGLAIARQIIKNHNGLLDCVSDPAQGSTFSVYLPVASPDLLRSLPDIAPTPVETRTQGLVLVIDDEMALRRLLAEALSHEGYTVIDAGNGQQGLNLFDDHREAVSLVICDLEMPGFNGREVVARIKNRVPGQQIIVSTGHISRADEKTFRQQGIQVLRKPYTIDQLLALIQQLHSKV